MNIEKQYELKHNIENIIVENFNNSCYSTLSTIIFNFIIDDIHELIENDEIKNDDLEIFHDDIHESIKNSILNRYFLFNVMPIYQDHKLINLIKINNFNYDVFKNIPYYLIVELLNNYQELIYNIDEKKYYENNTEYYTLFYNIEKIENNKYKFKQYKYIFNNNDVFIIYEFIDNKKLIEIFYKYIDPIIENIVDELIDVIKKYDEYII